MDYLFIYLFIIAVFSLPSSNGRRRCRIQNGKS